MEAIFAPLPPVPDHPRLEEEILQWWEDEQVFQQLRDKNHGGPKFSFMDGPITANAPAGVLLAQAAEGLLLVPALEQLAFESRMVGYVRQRGEDLLHRPIVASGNNGLPPRVLPSGT